jgi:hypothetical protein
MAIIKPTILATPVVLDIIKLVSDGKNQYDLPYYFMGQVMETNFDYESPQSLEAMGAVNGYQHLYLEGKGMPQSDAIQFNWLVKNKFYTLTAAAKSGDELLFARIGANDPEQNLRRDAALIMRRPEARDTVFAATIEPHGSYSPISELSVNPKSALAGVTVIHDSDDYTAVAIEDLELQSFVFIVVNTDPGPSKRHELTVDGKQYRWSGPYLLAETN